MMNIINRELTKFYLPLVDYPRVRYNNDEIDNFNLKQLKNNSTCIIIEFGRE